MGKPQMKLGGKKSSCLSPGWKKRNTQNYWIFVNNKATFFDWTSLWCVWLGKCDRDRMFQQNLDINGHVSPPSRVRLSVSCHDSIMAISILAILLMAATVPLFSLIKGPTLVLHSCWETSVSSWAPESKMKMWTSFCSGRLVWGIILAAAMLIPSSEGTWPRPPTTLTSASQKKNEDGSPFLLRSCEPQLLQQRRTCRSSVYPAVPKSAPVGSREKSNPALSRNREWTVTSTPSGNGAPWARLTLNLSRRGRGPSDVDSFCCVDRIKIKGREWCVSPAARWLRQMIKQVRIRQNSVMANKLNSRKVFGTSHICFFSRKKCCVLLSCPENNVPEERKRLTNGGIFSYLNLNYVKLFIYLLVSVHEATG